MTYVYRNNTIERFLPSGYSYSGYQDVSVVPEEASMCVWWYQSPMHFNIVALVSEIASYKQMLEMVIKRLNGRPIVLVTMALMYDAQCTMHDEVLAETAIEDYNTFLYSLAQENTNVKVVDIRRFYQQYPQDEWLDWKFYMMSQMGLNPRLSAAFQQWWKREMDAIALKRKKCLVLDLDNTLWGGILGEDGVEGIRLSGDYPGKAYHLWQEGLKELKKSGVILCLCSKNNEGDVMEVWEKREDMVLKKEDFAAWRINWQDKATNIKELAAELNIGLDAMVFVDDNPTERELIRQTLPMVSVPDWVQQPYELPKLYKTLVSGFFRVYAITDEDKKKTEQYRQNAERMHAQASFKNMEDYVASLNLRLKIESLELEDGAKITRAAQMTQKTNQFNLTTKRYEEGDIRKHIERGQVWVLSVSDRFGDYGISGLLILNEQDTIDTMLMSCRVLGKGIEEAFVKYVLGILKNQGVEKVEGMYIPTAKNSQVETFWPKIGFSMTDAVSDGRIVFSLYLPTADLTIKDYYMIEE